MDTTSPLSGIGWVRAALPTLITAAPVNLMAFPQFLAEVVDALVADRTKEVSRDVRLLRQRLPELPERQDGIHHDVLGDRRIARVRVCEVDERLPIVVKYLGKMMGAALHGILGGRPLAFFFRETTRENY